MKLRQFFYVLAASVIALLIVGTTGFYWLAANSPLKVLQEGGQTNPAASVFVPKQSPMMLSLLVNPARLAAFQLAITPLGERRQARLELEQLKQNLLSGTGLDYERDIQPWLGNEITLAVTTPDVDRDIQNGQQPGYLLAVATQDPLRSREFLQLFWQKRAVAGTDLVFEQYAGVKLIYGNKTKPEPSESPELQPQPSPPPTPTLTSGIVGDRFVLFANYPKVLRDAINNAQSPDLNLSSSSTYQDALQGLPSRQVGLGFVNLPQLETWLAGEFSTRDTIDTSNYRSPLYDSLVVAMELDRRGLLAETALLTSANQILSPAKPLRSQPVKALQFIPIESSVIAAGEDLKNLWSQIEAELATYNTSFVLVNQLLNSVKTLWGANLTDLLDWIQGEYAVGILPHLDQPNWIVVAERSEATETAVQNLDAIAQRQGLSTGTLSLGDQQVVAWTKLSMLSTTVSQPGPQTVQAEVQGLRASVGNYEIFASSVEAMNQALQAPKKSLISSDQFRQAIAPLASNNDGYLYIDWLAVQDLVKQRLPLLKLIEGAGQPILEHARSLTITSYGSEQNLRRGAIFIRISNAL
jgi:hypothetical protein